MRNPKPIFGLWLYLTSILFFFLEWAVGALVIHYVSKWMGLGVTTQRVLATLWLIWASFRATSRHSRRKEAVSQRYSNSELLQHDSPTDQSIAEKMESTGRTRKEVDEDLKHFGF